MKLRTSLCVPAIVLVLVAPGQAAAPGDSQVAADRKAYACERCSAEENPEKTLPPPAGREVPFHRLEGYLIQVEGQIGGQDRLKFILDTGASMSMVDTKIADVLGLKRQPAEHCYKNFVRESGRPRSVTLFGGCTLVFVLIDAEPPNLRLQCLPWNAELSRQLRRSTSFVGPRLCES